MPHPTPAARLELNVEELERDVELGAGTAGEARLRAVLDGTVGLLNTVDELVAFVPPAVNPVVIYREHLAALQAARDAIVAEAEDLIVGVQVEEAPADA